MLCHSLDFLFLLTLPPYEQRTHCDSECGERDNSSQIFHLTSPFHVNTFSYQPKAAACEDQSTQDLEEV